MVGVDVSFEHPCDPQTPLLRVRENSVGRLGRDCSARRIEVEHRVDHSGFATLWIGDEIAHAISRFVEKAVDLGCRAHRSRLPGFSKPWRAETNTAVWMFFARCLRNRR